MEFVRLSRFAGFSSTMYIVYSGIVVNSDSVAHIGLRQICGFDYFKGGKFGSLHNLNIVPLNSATKPYTSRYQQCENDTKSINRLTKKE